jgi:hypothetical protein
MQKDLTMVRDINLLNVASISRNGPRMTITESNNHQLTFSVVDGHLADEIMTLVEARIRALNVG